MSGPRIRPRIPAEQSSSPKLVTVSARTQDVGEAEESLPVSFSGEALEIGFNAEFLRDGIESVAGETVRFRLISPLRPCVLQAEGSDDFLYLIMPIRLAG